MSGRLSRKAKSAASTLFKRVASGQDWEDPAESKASKPQQAQAKTTLKKNLTTTKSPRSSPARATSEPRSQSPLPAKKATIKKAAPAPIHEPANDKETLQVEPKDKPADKNNAGKKSHKKQPKTKTKAKVVVKKIIEPSVQVGQTDASEVPVKRKRGRPRKYALPDDGASAVVKTKQPGAVSKPQQKVPKLIIVKSPVSSPVKVTNLASFGTAAASTNSISDSVGTAAKQDAAESCGQVLPPKNTVTVKVDVTKPENTAATTPVLSPTQSPEADPDTLEPAKKKKKKYWYSILDSQRKSPKTESHTTYKSMLPSDWKTTGHQEYITTNQLLTQIQPLPGATGATGNGPETECSLEMTVDSIDPVEPPVVKKKRGRKKKEVVQQPAPQTSSVPKFHETKEQIHTLDDQALESKKSPKSSLHPSLRLNQDQFCDIFGLIKTSELKKHGHMHKLHREAGGKLRRTIKPRMAPEMVYRKYTIAKGCTIQGLMEESEESDLPDSKESSPRSMLRNRMFHYEERVRRKPGLKDSPVQLTKSSSFKENEVDFLAQRKLDFNCQVPIESPIESPKKREWLKPPCRKRTMLDFSENVSETQLGEKTSKPEGGESLKKAADKKKQFKKMPDMWVERPWMKEYISTTKAKMAAETKEREASDNAGSRRSARQQGTRRKQWWHLLRANPDEYENDPESEEAANAALTESSKAPKTEPPKEKKPVKISSKDMSDVIRWLEDEEEEEQVEREKQQLLERAKAAEEQFQAKKRKKKKKKTPEGGHLSAVSEAARVSILEQLKPVLDSLLKDPEQASEGNIIELSLPRAFTVKDEPEEKAEKSVASSATEDAESEALPSLGYRSKADECVSPHMCPVCWINDHMYCRNMKRVARDLPACGGCIHYIPCDHYRHLKTSLVYEYRKGPAAPEVLNTGFEQSGVRSLTIEDGKVHDPENKKPPVCGEDLICEETIFESDSDPSAPCSPEGLDLLRLHLKVREAQIKQSLGVSKMPATPYPMSVQEVIEERIVLDEKVCDLEPEEFGAEVVVGSDGSGHSPSHSFSSDLDHDYRNGLPSSIVQSFPSDVLATSVTNKMRIRILSVPSDTVKQKLIHDKDHTLVKVTVDKSGSNQVVLALPNSSSKEVKPFVKPDPLSLLNTDYLGEVIVQEALKVINSGDPTPRMLTLTLGQKVIEEAKEALNIKKKKKKKKKMEKIVAEEEVPIKEEVMEDSQRSPEKETTDGNEFWVDDIPWTIETISDQDEGSDSSVVGGSAEQEANSSLMFTIDQNNTGQKIVSVSKEVRQFTSDLHPKGDAGKVPSLPASEEETATVTMGEDATTEKREGNDNKDTAMDTNADTNTDPIDQSVQTNDPSSEASGKNSGEKKDMLCFTTKDIRERKPDLLEYIQEANLVPMILSKLQTEKESIQADMKDSQLAEYIREVREELEQKKCLLAALKSEKEVLVETIDKEEDLLQTNDAEAASLRRKREEVEKNLSLYKEKKLAAEKTMAAIKEKFGLTVSNNQLDSAQPQETTTAEDHEVARTLNSGMALTSQPNIIMDELGKPVVVTGMSIGELKDVCVEVRLDQSGKPIGVPTSQDVASGELLTVVQPLVTPSGRWQLPGIPMSTVQPGGVTQVASQQLNLNQVSAAELVSAVSPSMTAIATQLPAAQPITALPANSIAPAQILQMGNTMATSQFTPATVITAPIQPAVAPISINANTPSALRAALSSPTSTSPKTKPASAKTSLLKKPTRRPSAGKGQPPKAKGKAAGPKVKVSKETFPGGLQLLKMKLPNSDKDGYFVESTDGTLIQVTQIVMSEDKVSQLKLAVQKPVVNAAGVQTTVGLPQPQVGVSVNNVVMGSAPPTTCTATAMSKQVGLPSFSRKTSTLVQPPIPCSRPIPVKSGKPKKKPLQMPLQIPVCLAQLVPASNQIVTAPLSKPQLMQANVPIRPKPGQQLGMQPASQSYIILPGDSSLSQAVASSSTTLSSASAFPQVSVAPLDPKQVGAPLIYQQLSPTALQQGLVSSVVTPQGLMSLVACQQKPTPSTGTAQADLNIATGTQVTPSRPTPVMSLLQVTPSRSTPVTSLLHPQVALPLGVVKQSTGQPDIQLIMGGANTLTGQVAFNQSATSLIPQPVSNQQVLSIAETTPANVSDPTPQVPPVPQVQESFSNTLQQEEPAALAANQISTPYTDNSAAYAHEALQTLIAALHGGSEEPILLASDSEAADLAALAEAAAAAAVDIDTTKQPIGGKLSLKPVAENGNPLVSNLNEVEQIQNVQPTLPPGAREKLDGVHYAQQDGSTKQGFQSSAAQLVQNVLAQSGINLEENQPGVAFGNSNLSSQIKVSKGTVQSDNVGGQFTVDGELATLTSHQVQSAAHVQIDAIGVDASSTQSLQSEQGQIAHHEQAVQLEQVQLPSGQYEQVQLPTGEFVQIPVGQYEQVQAPAEQVQVSAEQYVQVQLPTGECIQIPAGQYEQVQAPLEQVQVSAEQYVQAPGEQFEQVQAPMEQVQVQAPAEQVQVSAEQYVQAPGEQYEQVQAPMEQVQVQVSAEQYVQVQAPVEQVQEPTEQVEVSAEQYVQVQAPVEQVQLSAEQYVQAPAEQYEQVQAPVEQYVEVRAQIPTTQIQVSSEQVKVTTTEQYQQVEQYEQVQLPTEHYEQVQVAYEHIQIPTEQGEQAQVVTEQFQQVQLPSEQYEQTQAPVEQCEQVQTHFKQIQAHPEQGHNEQEQIHHGEHVQVQLEQYEQVRTSVEHVQQGEQMILPGQYTQVQIPLGQAEQFEQIQVHNEQTEQLTEESSQQQVGTKPTEQVNVPGQQSEEYNQVQMETLYQQQPVEQTVQYEVHEEGVPIVSTPGLPLALAQNVEVLQSFQQQGMLQSASALDSAKVEVQPVVAGFSGQTGIDLLADVINSTLLGQNLVPTEDSPDGV